MQRGVLLAFFAFSAADLCAQSVESFDRSELVVSRPAPLVQNSRREGILPQLHDNGAFATSVGNGAGGADLSTLQNTSLGMGTLGFTASTAGAFSLADDFAVPSGQSWDIRQLEFFAYQTGSTTTSSFSDLRFRIWNGRPGNKGAAVIYGDLDTNVFASSSWSNVYRVTETSASGTERPIMATSASLGAGILLSTGTYWVEYKLGGSLPSGPFVPPLTTIGQNATGDARQFNGTTWVDIMDSGSVTPQGVPFRLFGHVVTASTFGSKWKASIKPDRDSGILAMRSESEEVFSLRSNDTFACGAILNGTITRDLNDQLVAALDLADLQHIVDAYYGVGAINVVGIISQRSKFKHKEGVAPKPGKLSFACKAEVEIAGGFTMVISVKFSGLELL